MPPLTVLLTGTRAPATLDLARRLHRSGYRVLGADSMKFPLARYSNAFADHFRLPSPRFLPSLWLSALTDLLDTAKVDLLWPTCEEVFYVAQHHEALSTRVTMMCDPLTKLLPLHHKFQFTELIAGLGTQLQAPASWPANEAPEHERLVWKPNFSRFAARTRFHDPPPQREGWMAQRFVQGREFCSWALCRQGRVHVQTMYTNAVRAGRGAGCAFVPHWSPEAAEFVITVVQRLHFTGALAFDYITTETGETMVLECNPRMTSGIHLLPPEVNFADLLEQGLTSPPPMQPAQLKLPVLFLKPSLLTTSSDVIFQAADQAPFWTQFLGAGEFALRALRTGVSLLAATTHDLEYNG